MNNTATFQVGLCDSPFASWSSCGWCLYGAFPLTFPCAQMSLRYKALNHLSPGSGWEHYICCQGYFPPCLCFQPGHCGEKEMPRTCMLCESYCCPGFAMSASRFVVMDHYSLQSDPCDNRLIRANNCIQCLACICHIAAVFDKNLRELAQIIDCIADLVFWSTAGCMTAQVAYEIKYREALNQPSTYQSFDAPNP
jgi:hypothetical protein